MSKTAIKKMDPVNLKKYIEELSEKLEVEAVTEFDSIAKMRLHCLDLENKVLADQGQAVDEKKDAEDKSKYDTSNRRGPNLGTGKYAKKRIMEGADNKAILEEIREKFPAAKTTNASINYYRNRLKQEGMDRTPEALNKKADQLEAEAKELREQAKTLAKELEAKAKEEAAAAEKAKQEEAQKEAA